MEDEQISEREFEDVWGVYLKPSGDLFEFEDVQHQPLNHVWTVCESGDDADGNWYAAPGFHIVNKLGYVMTKKAWTDSTRDANYFLDDFEHDDADEHDGDGHDT
ncbi:MAG TPA: hypothetical protein VFG73_06315 [Rhodanobacteraceae bacterium]|nr:hypothetical protein [Rhodanobacteraceae bacterium]